MMDKKEVRIVIAEDDATQGKALVEAVKSLGFQAQLYAKPEELLAAVRYNPAHLYIIDCMLPKINGVNLALKLRDDGSADVPIIFMSGLFKDKGFVRETMQKTAAIAFHTKPLQLELLLSDIKNALAALTTPDAADAPFYSVLTAPEIKPEALSSLLSQTAFIHGFEIPRLISLVTIGKLSGVFHLKAADADPVKIHFNSGTISKVEMKVTKSYFGALLLERNLLEPDELTRVLNSKGSKPIGERLVDENLLSPHMIGVVSAIQTGLRLSGIISDKNYDVSFETLVLINNYIADSLQLLPLYCDWVKTKVPNSWLQTFYLSLHDNVIFRTNDFSDSHPAFKLDPLDRNAKLVSMLKSRCTINMLINQHAASEEDIYNCIHILVLARMIYFDKTVTEQNATEHIARLTKVDADLARRNYFEILGANKTSKTADIRRAYTELAKTFHPDRLPQQSPQELRDIANKVFNQATAAYETLSDPDRRAQYVNELEKGQAVQILQSESLTEDGRSLLKSSQVEKALEKFTEAASLRPPTSELKLYTMWARILILNTERNSDTVVSIQSQLGKIPPEDRHSPLYYIVKGMFQRYLGETDAARHNFKQALFMDPNFKEAQRELRFLELSNTNKPVDLLNGDLGTVIGALFKKKR